MSEKKENRGGARPNTGPKRVKKTVSEGVKAAYIRAAKKLAKINGRTIEEQVLMMVYDKDVQDAVKVGILKAYNEALLVKETEQTITTKDATPKIYLPKRDEDPALRVVQGGK